MNYTTQQVTDPITLALSYLASADDHGESARTSRDLAEHEFAEGRARNGREASSLAGRFRECERLDLQRAKAHAEVAQAQALASIADSLSRLALAQ